MDSSALLDQLRRLRKNAQRAECDLHNAVAEVFSPGSVVRWRHGRSIRSGVIIRTSGARLFVETETSDGYWIESYPVIGIGQLPAVAITEKEK